MASYQSKELIPWTAQTRTVPLKVLIVGVWRTGTSSLLQAFQDLGYYNTYPREAPSANTWNSLTYTKAWNEVIDDKFVHGKTVGREQFDELLGDCMVVSGVPCFIFLEELLAAYPDAKVILTTRDLDSWYTSILSSLEYISTRPIIRVATVFDAWVRERQAYLDRLKYWGWFDNLPAFGRMVHRNHIERVRGLVAMGKIQKDAYLELEVGHGWEPLCEFLGEDVPPGKPYPKVNDQKSLHEMFHTSLIPAAWWIVFRSVAIGTVPVAMLGGIWWLRRTRFDLASLKALVSKG